MFGWTIIFHVPILSAPADEVLKKGRGFRVSILHGDMRVIMPRSYKFFEGQNEFPMRLNDLPVKPRSPLLWLSLC
jgi:hypothetical protein